jgi:hypothetical protein
MPLSKDSWNLVLVEKGRFVCVRKDGREIGFSSLEQLLAYTSVDLLDKTYLAYEPGIGRFLDEAAGVGIDFSADMLAGIDRSADFETALAPYQPLIFSLESLFARFDPIQANLADPYWGLTTEQRAYAQKLAQIEATDSGFVRVVEDLIDTLVAKGAVALTDLPQAARDKINARKAIREEL